MDSVDLNLDVLYCLGLSFIKEKDGGKAYHLSYSDRLQLFALNKQVKLGPYRPEVAGSEVGLFDLVGSDRRQRWQELGNLSAQDAKTTFVKLIADSCPLFRPYVEAHQRKQMAIETDDADEKCLSEEAAAPMVQQEVVSLSVQSTDVDAENAIELEESDKQLRRQQREFQIRAALNQQTINQFRQYALEQHPKDSIKQEDLIRQLQEQHFHQYMTQIYQQQIVHQQQQYKQLLAHQYNHLEEDDELVVLPGREELSVCADQERLTQLVSEDINNIDVEESDLELPQIVPASMWTRRDIHEFKQQIYKENRECCIQIGSLATATIRVPTHEEGSCVFWEFATDHNDIGFGVYFEWNLSHSDKVTVHISESDDEEDDEQESPSEKVVDVESGDAIANSNGLVHKKRGPEIPTDEIIPVYRRDCHQEVYCGSHQYPGHGVYLLKFDNSYSLWRSKWLYYRVYYTR